MDNQNMNQNMDPNMNQNMDPNMSQNMDPNMNQNIDPNMNQNMNQNMNPNIYQQPMYQQQMYQPYPGELEEPVSLGEWITSLLILMIPCVNIVMIFVWAFGSGTKKSKSNYFKASLIMSAIFLAIYIVIWIVILAVGGITYFDFY